MHVVLQWRTGPRQRLASAESLISNDACFLTNSQNYLHPFSQILSPVAVPSVADLAHSMLVLALQADLMAH